MPDPTRSCPSDDPQSRFPVPGNELSALAEQVKSCTSVGDLAFLLEIASGVASRARCDVLAGIGSVLYREGDGSVPESLTIRGVDHLLMEDAYAYFQAQRAEGVTVEQVRTLLGALRALDAAWWAVSAASKALKTSTSTEATEATEGATS
jgi:hypothetical protein